jgi:hypothetical protein
VNGVRAGAPLLRLFFVTSLPVPTAESAHRVYSVDFSSEFILILAAIDDAAHPRSKIAVTSS